ncbi:hypothetical protein PPYR_00882 [Photinus pyralis]|uniref:Uncharacterized protein n=1 Tax=Photinus pyralis TaxID=7054 RepID=A0A1Y1L7K2_PHOPY|nr:uncharacterized protein LOC116159941 [Photinus pyralis]KAB0803912.1 hypothetical protein PPYR_00882 [Photinus pyralis]
MEKGKMGGRRTGRGSGRGRSWMKLNSVPRPGGVPADIVSFMDKITSYLSLNDQEGLQYAKLIELIELIDDKDDSIVLSRKVKHVRQLWVELCQNGDEISDSFYYLYSKCLLNTNLATKFVTVIALPPFDTDLHGKKLVILLVQCLQSHYDARTAFQTDHPEAFRNFVQMMGEFFHKAKGPSNSIDKLLKEPNLVCLEMLLTKGQEPDLSLFTKLLHRNGALFESSDTKTVSSLLSQVRDVLILDTKLTLISKAWLLLAIDIANSRFGPLPKEIHKFYEDKLGENEMINFQNTHSSLSIEILQPNKAFDSYKSSVNVLQVKPSESSSFEQTNSQNNSLPPTDTKRLGRPILGVGVRDQGGWE